jgi:hypothetical protein
VIQPTKDVSPQQARFIAGLLKHRFPWLDGEGGRELSRAEVIMDLHDLHDILVGIADKESDRCDRCHRKVEETRPGSVLQLVERNGFDFLCVDCNSIPNPKPLRDFCSNETVEQLAKAALAMTEEYCELVNSGDCGSWEPELNDRVIAARKAITAALEELFPVIS